MVKLYARRRRTSRTVKVIAVFCSIGFVQWSDTTINVKDSQRFVAEMNKLGLLKLYHSLVVSLRVSCRSL